MKVILKLRTELSSLFSFLKWLDDAKFRHLSDKQKRDDILILMVLELGFIVPLGLIIAAFDYFEIITLPDHSVIEMFKNYSFIEIFFYGVIIAPFFEEVIFRGFIVFRRFYPLILLVDILTNSGRSKFVVLRQIRSLWNYVFPILVVASSLLFGYVHIFNYQGHVDLVFIPLLIAPQVVSGFFLVYARVRYGLVWSMLLHASTNLVLISLQYMLPLE